MAHSPHSSSLHRDPSDDLFDYFHPQVSTPSTSYFGGFPSIDAANLDFWPPPEDPFLSGFDRSNSSSMLFSPASLTTTADRSASEEPSLETATDVSSSAIDTTKIEISPETPCNLGTLSSSISKLGMPSYDPIELPDLPDILTSNAFPSQLTGVVAVPGFKGKNYQQPSMDRVKYGSVGGIAKFEGGECPLPLAAASSLETLSQRAGESGQRRWGEYSSCLSPALSAGVMAEPELIVQNSFDAGLLAAYQGSLDLNYGRSEQTTGVMMKNDDNRSLVEYASNHRSDKHQSRIINTGDKEMKNPLQLTDADFAAGFQAASKVALSVPLPSFVTNLSVGFDSSVSAVSESGESSNHHSTSATDRSLVCDNGSGVPGNLNVPANLSLPPPTEFELPTGFFDLEEIKPKLCGQTRSNSLIRSKSKSEVKVEFDPHSVLAGLLPRNGNQKSSHRRRKSKRKRKEMDSSSSSVDDSSSELPRPLPPSQPSANGSSSSTIANVEEFHPLEIGNGYQSADDINEPEPTFDEKVFTRRTKEDLKRNEKFLNLRTVGYAFSMTVRMPRCVNGECAESRMERLIRHLCEHRWAKKEECEGPPRLNAEDKSLDWQSGLACRIDEDPAVPQLIREEKKARRGRPPKNPPPPKPVFPPIDDEAKEVARRVTVALNFELLGLMDPSDQEDCITVMNRDLNNWHDLSVMLSALFGGDVEVWHLHSDAIAIVNDGRYYRMKRAWFMTMREKSNRKKNTRRKGECATAAAVPSSSAKKRSRKK